ncbi:hypothetical protein NHF39_28045 [Pseudomonas proteolytica]|nr:hypothetical protein [Pseudomonas proteolytica]USW94965.1 hypothetical protein NHF39_28045 [Pseudomonas proteolytica]USX01002.1 hypothetical protein NHF41_03630 [Pseudomonas proteolytica]
MGGDEQQSRQDLEKQVAVEQREADFRWLMADPRGRRFMWATLGDYGLFRTSFNHLPGQTEFNEGQRNAGLLLWGALTGCALSNTGLWQPRTRPSQPNLRTIRRLMNERFDDETAGPRADE